MHGHGTAVSTFFTFWPGSAPGGGWSDLGAALHLPLPGACSSFLWLQPGDTHFCSAGERCASWVLNFCSSAASLACARRLVGSGSWAKLASCACTVAAFLVDV